MCWKIGGNVRLFFFLLHGINSFNSFWSWLRIEFCALGFAFWWWSYYCFARRRGKLVLEAWWRPYWDLAREVNIQKRWSGESSGCRIPFGYYILTVRKKLGSGFEVRFQQKTSIISKENITSDPLQSSYPHPAKHSFNLDLSVFLHIPKCILTSQKFDLRN